MLARRRKSSDRPVKRDSSPMTRASRSAGRVTPYIRAGRYSSMAKVRASARKASMSLFQAVRSTRLWYQAVAAKPGIRPT